MRLAPIPERHDASSMDTQTSLCYLVGFLKAIEIAAGRRARVGANAYARGGDSIEGLSDFLRERDIAFERLVAAPVSRDASSPKSGPRPPI